jgi:hypothetical protein
MSRQGMVKRHEIHSLDSTSREQKAVERITRRRFRINSRKDARGFNYQQHETHAFYELRQLRNRRFDRQFAETELDCDFPKTSHACVQRHWGAEKCFPHSLVEPFLDQGDRNACVEKQTHRSGLCFHQKVLRKRFVEILGHRAEDSIDPMLALEFFDCFQPQPPALAVRDKVQNRFAVPCNDNRLSSLDKASQCGKPVLGVFDGYHF